MGVRFGRYELLRRLGRGGMAEIFLARYRGPERFEKRLVIKRVLPQRSRDRAFIELFIEEARLHVSLSHGNLVPVFDFGRVGNSYFIAMEHVAGVDLASLLTARRGIGLPPALVAYIGIELCRGLAYVHRRGLVHRDVTPRNVLLSTDGEVKLSDFGVTLVSDAATETDVRGTPAYMAPEQARGELPDGRADLYAVGLVLAEALSAARVRPRHEGAAALEAAKAAQPLSLEGALGAVINRATAPAAADRPADADTMLAALETAARELPPSGASPARALAGLVAELASANEGEAPDVKDAGGPETYFRDAATEADGVRALQATVDGDAARRRIATIAVAALGVALVVGGGLAIRRSRHAAPLPGVASRDAATTAAATPAGAAATALPAADAGAPAIERAASTPPHHAPSRTPEPATATAATGSLRVQCTPWCVLLVDGRRHGDDGRLHVLSLPSGTHRIAAQRLDDEKERVVEISARAPLSISFQFD